MTRSQTNQHVQHVRQPAYIPGNRICEGSPICRLECASRAHCRRKLPGGSTIKYCHFKTEASLEAEHMQQMAFWNSKPETRRCGRDQDGGDWHRSKYLPLCTALLAKGIFATAFWVGSVEHIHVNFCSIQRLALKSLCHDSAQSDARLHSSVYRALERAPK